MDFSNNWIVSLVEDYIGVKEKQPLFISDWNSTYENPDFLNNLIGPALDNSLKPFKYLYGYDQAFIKNIIAGQYLSENSAEISSADFSNLSLAFTVSPTASLYLTINLLFQNGIHRFLVLTPTYHSILTTLKGINASIVYYHLKDSVNFEIDIHKLFDTISEQDIEAVIFCDPIYSCGINVPTSLYQLMVEYCSQAGIWIIADYALGGAEWNKFNRSLTLEKIKIACSYDKFVFIESTSKRLQLNGLKSSVVLTNKSLAYKIEDYSTRVYGGFSLPQIALLERLYSSELSPTVSELIDNNIRTVQNNYETLNTFLAKTDFELYPANSGNFTMIVHKKYRIMDVDSKAIVKAYLFEEDLLVFPTFQYFLYKENRFGFRVNLLQNLLNFWNPLSNCLRKDILSF